MLTGNCGLVLINRNCRVFIYIYRDNRCIYMILRLFRFIEGSKDAVSYRKEAIVILGRGLVFVSSAPNKTL
jgi:hypothetical protein